MSNAYEKQKQQGFVLENDGKATNLWVWGTELVRLCPNFNYVLVFGAT